MLFLSFVDTAGKVNMYEQSADGGVQAYLWRGELELLRLVDGFFAPGNTWSGSEQSRDVVLEPVDLWTAGQDRCLLGGLLPDSWESVQTGWISL